MFELCTLCSIHILSVVGSCSDGLLGWRRQAFSVRSVGYCSCSMLVMDIDCESFDASAQEAVDICCEHLVSS